MTYRPSPVTTLICVFALAGLSLAAGCSDDSGGMICVPGADKVCKCASGASGTSDCGAANDGATPPCSVTADTGTCLGIETCHAMAGGAPPPHLCPSPGAAARLDLHG